MKIIINPNTNIVSHYLEDSVRISHINDTQIIIGKVIVNNMTPESNVVIENVNTCSFQFISHQLKYEDGIWSIIDEDKYRSLLPVPKEVTMRQARLALLKNNLLSTVQSAINSLPEPDKSLVAIEWEYSSVLVRDDPWVITLTQSLNLTDEQVDNLFKEAIAL